MRPAPMPATGVFKIVLIGRMIMKPIQMNRLPLAALLLTASAANAQRADLSQVQIKTTDLGNMTYMLEGQGGNIAVAVGSDGILMVDGQFAPLSEKITAGNKAIP